MVIPLVSIVITNYNYASYIDEAIKSVSAQTYPNLELIVVDDASTDNSSEIISGLKSELENRFVRFLFIQNKSNKGINGSLNIALPLVQGAITEIFDADDILDISHVQKMVDALLTAHKEDGAIAFTYCNCYITNAVGKVLQAGLSKPFSSELIKTESFLPRPSPIFTNILLKYLPLPEKSKADPKHELWERICADGHKGFYVQEPLFYYRAHNRNYSSIGEKIRNLIEKGLLSVPINLSDYWPT